MRVGRRECDVMWSVTAVAVSAYHSLSLDVCPPVQEDLDGPEAAFLSSPVEGSPSTLSDTQRETSHHVTQIHGILLPHLQYIHI